MNYFVCRSYCIKLNNILTCVLLLTRVRLPADQRPPTVPLAGVHPALLVAGADHLRDDGLRGGGVSLGALGVRHDGQRGGSQTLTMDPVMS